MGELSGAELDLAVGKALGLDVEIDGARCIRNLPFDPVIGRGDFVGFSPSTDWALGGPIIEHERIAIDIDPDTTSRRMGTTWQPGGWSACVRGIDDSGDDWEASGPTPLIAAMRAYVASKA